MEQVGKTPIFRRPRVKVAPGFERDHRSGLGGAIEVARGLPDDAGGASLAVSVRGLRKAYGPVEAVRGIDLKIPVGQIFALLGPNGAGKTTTVEILEGYRPRDAGEVEVLGCDPASGRARLKPRIGIVFQSTAVEPYLTVRETVAMYASLYRRPRGVDQVIDVVGLGEKPNERVVRLSGGQQRRLEMAIALVGDPDLLFLDEPTTGFDPGARHEAWEVIRSLAALGKTVVLTTHYMDEAQYLGDRVVVIAMGRIVAEGPPSTLGLRESRGVRIRYRSPSGAMPPASLEGVTSADGFVEVHVDDPVVALHDLTGWAIERELPLEGLEVVRPSLEDVYLALTRGPDEGTER
jgi:ABC-2 type transport system ATP-binding protein